MDKTRTGWAYTGKRALLAVFAVLLLLPAAASAAPPPVGGLTELSGTSACVSSDGSSEAGAHTCQVGRGLAHAESVTVSPDGRFAYVGSYAASNGPSLTAFSRDPATGALTQLPGATGCYTPDGSSQAGPNTCTKVLGLGNGDGRDLAITSDGRFAYTVNQHADSSTPTSAIVLFSRDPATGALTQLPGTAGCISPNGSSQAGANTCQTLATLGTPYSVTLSSDDRFLYINDFAAPHRLHVLARNPSTGALNEVQCLAEGSSPPNGCTTARDVGDVQTVVLSPDGSHAYDGDDSTNGLSIFDRDPVTGLLTQQGGAAGCVSETGHDDTGATTCGVARALGYGLTISPDGHTLYVASSRHAPGLNGGLAILHVYDDGSVSQLPGAAGCISDTGNDNADNPTCAVGRGLDESYGLTIAPDGRTVYVAGDTVTTAGLAVFSIDQSTGEATQLPGLAGCVTADGASEGTPGVCTQGPATADDWIPTVSPDGSSVYLASFGDQAVAAFRRETGPTCTGTSASTAYQTPVTLTLSCTDPDGDPLSTSLVTAPAHGTLGTVAQTVTYTPAQGYTGSDTFTFDATDGTNMSAAATATITVAAPPAPPAVQNTPPAARVTKATQAHRRWREGKHGGTTFSFTLNEAARVIFTFTQKNHQRPLGRLTIAGHRGRNNVTFNGAVNRHTKLKPGTYTVTITTGASTPLRLTFTILK